MNYLLPDLQSASITGKRIVVRADFDVPLIETIDDGQSDVKIGDDIRLLASWHTIEYLIKQNTCSIIGHLGRPQGKKDMKLSTWPIAKWYADKLHVPLAAIEKQSIHGFDAWKVNEKIIIFENLRFYAGEEENDTEFVRKLALLGDVYINEAFAMVHRAHASIVGIPRLLPHYAGINLMREVSVLTEIITNPERPLLVIIGGKKVETKLPLLTNMEKIADYLLVGGKIAPQAQEVFTHEEKKHAQIIIASTNAAGTDITSESIEKFKHFISLAKTTIWNGPVGLIQPVVTGTEKGTLEIAQAIAQSSSYSVIGGGDTVEYIRSIGLGDKFNFISTGGGAMLTLLSGNELPGLIALME